MYGCHHDQFEQKMVKKANTHQSLHCTAWLSIDSIIYKAENVQNFLIAQSDTTSNAFQDLCERKPANSNHTNELQEIRGIQLLVLPLARTVVISPLPFATEEAVPNADRARAEVAVKNFMLMI
jgi:hypothetical protein